MLRSLNDLITDYGVTAPDGDIGKVSDFYFEDTRWIVRYMVVDTGSFWRGAHRVLVSPLAVLETAWPARVVHLAMSQEKVKNSPGVELDRPISRQFERDYFHYYGWPFYWGGDQGMWGAWGSQPSWRVPLPGHHWKRNNRVKVLPICVRFGR